MAKLSISIVKGKGSINHNNREFITDNVDRNRTPENITYKRESIEEAYKNCFSKSIEEYNTRQKRADRRIDGVKGYMEQIRNSKNGEKLFYENVVQVGNMYDSHIGTQQGEVCKKILDDYMRNFQKRNPNLYVFNAVMHCDEQTPHLHINYIPLARGYKQGLKVRNSLDRAFKEQGIQGKSNKYENRTIMWQNKEKNYIESIIKSYGLERAPDRGLNREHLTIEQYKAISEHIHNEVKNINKKIDFEPVLFNKNIVKVNKNDLENLEKRAKLSLVHEKFTKDLSQESKKDRNQIKDELAKAEKLYQKQKNINIKHDELIKKYKSLYKAYEDRGQKIENLKQENKLLKGQISHIRAEFDNKIQKATEPLKERIEKLREGFIGGYESITNIVKAVGMLKYDDEYKIENLTSKQDKLIEGITKYSIDWAKQEGFTEFAEDMKKHIGISPGILRVIKQLDKNKDDLELEL